MKVIVVDTSAILPLFLPDESSVYARGIIEVRNVASLKSSTLIMAEFANGLLSAFRRKRLTYAELVSAHNFFSSFEIELFDNVSRGQVFTIHELAYRRQLSYYDALYLALAIEERGALATADNALRKAATAEGVEVIE